MKQLTITIDDFLYDFYRKIGNNVGKTPEKTIEDALFRLAGELAMEAIKREVSMYRAGCQGRQSHPPLQRFIVPTASTTHKKRALRLSFFLFLLIILPPAEQLR